MDGTSCSTGQPVASFNDFKVTSSTDPAYFVAEEVTSAPSGSGSLGPVEFRNLSYLNCENVVILSSNSQSLGCSSWQEVTSLTAISACGGVDGDTVTAGASSNCNIANPYGVTVLGSNDIIAGTGEQLIQNGALLWPVTYNLEVSAPSQVSVTIDGSPYTGLIDVSLLQGSHSISVPQIVQIDATDQLRFAGWSDGSTELSRIIDLHSDTNLQAIYVQQYRLTIVSPFPSSGEGWYDQGTVANFYTNSVPHVTKTLGLSIFLGWHNENGALITRWKSGSIVMNQSYTLDAYWLTLNYFFPFVIGALAAIVVLGFQLRRWQDETGETATIDDPIPMPIPPHTMHELDDSAGEKSSRHVCRSCHAEVLRDRLICPKCGMPATYL